MTDKKVSFKIVCPLCKKNITEPAMILNLSSTAKILAMHYQMHQTHQIHDAYLLLNKCDEHFSKTRVPIKLHQEIKMHLKAVEKLDKEIEKLKGE